MTLQKQKRKIEQIPQVAQKGFHQPPMVGASVTRAFLVAALLVMFALLVSSFRFILHTHSRSMLCPREGGRGLTCYWRVGSFTLLLSLSLPLSRCFSLILNPGQVGREDLSLAVQPIERRLELGVARVLGLRLGLYPLFHCHTFPTHLARSSVTRRVVVLVGICQKFRYATGLRKGYGVAGRPQKEYSKPAREAME